MKHATCYRTAGDVRITRYSVERPAEAARTALVSALDRRPGMFLGSDYEYPGRYRKGAIGFVDPPVRIETRGYRFSLTATGPRGKVLLEILRDAVVGHPHVAESETDAMRLSGRVRTPEAVVDEAQRTRQPSVFSVLRAVQERLAAPEEPHLGLFAAFGYDLIYQFEPLESLRPRPDDQRDLVAFLPDKVTCFDAAGERAIDFLYDFESATSSTVGLSRPPAPEDRPDAPAKGGAVDAGRTGDGDFAPGDYAALVREALPYFQRGDLLEVVPSRVLSEPCRAAPSRIFETLRRINPSPYMYCLNLGGEHLIGGSPEMFLRVSGRRVESCPISGTIRRGRDAVEDAERIRQLLNSAKDEAELTMCTDVDRNDKARICEPGSVKVIGRRQIEIYSHLIHTVDHTEGLLPPDFDGLDAFLSQMWAVTVTGAPKRAAVAFIEAHERSPRRWYGGAVGDLGFDGTLNTGLTLRTMRLAGGMAEIRAGATLLADSDPESEEEETLTKAAALQAVLESVRDDATGRGAVAGQAGDGAAARGEPEAAPAHAGKRVLMVDCEDSFTHMLAACFRATGAAVTVLRGEAARAALPAERWSLVLFSPGPGRPSDFGVPAMVRACLEWDLPVFGVCLGFQGIVEALGGRVVQMPAPYHGRSSPVIPTPGHPLFRGLEEPFEAGRYHALCAEPDSLPAALTPIAHAPDGTIMAAAHAERPVAGVQFHPESIMTAADSRGQRLVDAVMRELSRPPRAAAVAVLEPTPAIR